MATAGKDIPTTRSAGPSPAPIRIVGIDIPIGDLAVLWIKIAVSAIPAIALISLVVIVAATLIGGAMHALNSR